MTIECISKTQPFHQELLILVWLSELSYPFFIKDWKGFQSNIINHAKLCFIDILEISDEMIWSDIVGIFIKNLNISPKAIIIYFIGIFINVR